MTDLVIGAVWRADDGREVRCLGVNGEMLHYEMRRGPTEPWTVYQPLPEIFFWSWVQSCHAEQIL